MLRAKQLGDVIFNMNTLFIQEEENDGSIIGESFISASGTHVVFQTKVNTPYVTLDSKQFGWIDESQRVALIDMRRHLDTFFTLTYNDGTIDLVRFAHEKSMEFTPLFEGATKYTAVIPLAKVQ